MSRESSLDRKSSLDIESLHRIMARLRSPDGCPWDRAQTHETLRPYLIEEAYEVIDALEAGNSTELCEELGDLLLQIVFHAQLAEERNEFGLGDVIRSINEKMIRRHPHVFGAESATNSAEVHSRWEELKRAEGRGLFDGLPKHLPALLRAQRVGEKVSNLGFDWAEIQPVVDKIREELDELEAEFGAEESRVDAELGDVLFAITNLARHLEVNAESALSGSTARFERRFLEVQSIASERGRDLRDCPLAELDEMWEQAKRTLTSLEKSN